MPRVNVITNEELFKKDLEAYQDQAGDFNYKYDVCWNCAHRLNLKILVEKTGISASWAMDQSGQNVLGKDGQPVWDDHPEFEGTEYKCEQCGQELGKQDDGDPRHLVVIVEA